MRNIAALYISNMQPVHQGTPKKDVSYQFRFIPDMMLVKKSRLLVVEVALRTSLRQFVEVPLLLTTRG